MVIRLPEVILVEVGEFISGVGTCARAKPTIQGTEEGILRQMVEQDGIVQGAGFFHLHNVTFNYPK